MKLLSGTFVLLACLFFITMEIEANIAIRTMFGNCSGGVFEMPGMDENQKALVLTNGHCLGVGKFRRKYPAPGEFIIDRDVPGFAILKKVKNERGKSIRYNKILFSTMTGVDLAVVQLELTYKEIKDEGYDVFSVAREFPKVGMNIEFNSFNKNVHSFCKVEKIAPIVKEGPWTWENSARLVAEEQCRFVHGQSGTIGIEKESGLIYGLAQTMYEGGTPCTFNNACEEDPETGEISTGKPYQGYSVPTASLYNCYLEEEGRFDFTIETCDLNQNK